MIGTHSSLEVIDSFAKAWQLIIKQGEDRMVDAESDDKQWRQRITWAACREPYKSELDGLATLWVQNQLSNAELALELWIMWSKKKFAETATKSPTIVLQSNTQIQEQIEVLVEAMRMATTMDSTTPEERREFLENSRAHLGRREDLQR